MLAKRKTAIMKEQEAHQNELRAEKRRRVSNKVEREKQMVAPSYVTISYERQLKKVATRGGILYNMILFFALLTPHYEIVIALFNAIHQAKTDAEKSENTERKGLTVYSIDCVSLKLMLTVRRLSDVYR